MPEPEPQLVPWNPAPVVTRGEEPPPETVGPLTAAECSALISKEVA